MATYLARRMRAQVSYLIEAAAAERLLSHNGVIGRHRELFLEMALRPWLPPTVRCGTGTIIDSHGHERPRSQDDIVLYDLALNPPVLASPDTSDGVFLFDGVHARVEVKSNLTNTELKHAYESAAQFHTLQFAKPTSDHPLESPRNYLFAYRGAAKFGGNDDPVSQVCEWLAPGELNPFAAICILDRATWTESRFQDQAGTQHNGTHVVLADGKHTEAIFFVAAVAETAFHQNRIRAVSAKSPLHDHLAPYLGYQDDILVCCPSCKKTRGRRRVQ